MAKKKTRKELLAEIRELKAENYRLQVKAGDLEDTLNYELEHQGQYDY